jgi:hypothetical protein
LLLDRIAQAVQEPTPGLPPQENQLARTAGTDQLVVDQVRRHPHQGQVFLALTNDFMTRRRRDQVGEAFERDGIAVVRIASPRRAARISAMGRAPGVDRKRREVAPVLED